MPTATSPSVPGAINTDDVSAPEREITQVALQHMVAGAAHAEVLDALIRVYAAIAHAHPCCTFPAAVGAQRTAEQLYRLAFHRPADAPIH